MVGSSAILGTQVLLGFALQRESFACQDQWQKQRNRHFLKYNPKGVSSPPRVATTGSISHGKYQGNFQKMNIDRARQGLAPGFGLRSAWHRLSRVAFSCSNLYGSMVMRVFGDGFVCLQVTHTWI